MIELVAEIGLDHRIAPELIEAASDAGFNSVKFQCWEVDDFDPGSTLREYELDDIDLFAYAKKARKKGLDVIVAPTVSTLDSVMDITKRIKISSDMAHNEFLISEICAYGGLELILSTGMIDLGETEKLAERLMGNNRLEYILHCVSEYPHSIYKAKFDRFMSLSRLCRSLVNRTSQTVIGYSDHTQGNSGSYVAAMLGAKMIEVHVGSKDYWTPDSCVSLDIDDMAEFVTQIRWAETCGR